MKTTARLMTEAERAASKVVEAAFERFLAAEDAHSELFREVHFSTPSEKWERLVTKSRAKVEAARLAFLALDAAHPHPYA